MPNKTKTKLLKCDGAGENEMKTDSAKVPVEYIITTTSDWTKFEIIEGGQWQNLQVKCIAGEDRLVREVTNDIKSIRLDKNGDDELPVIIRATCLLNIPKRNLQVQTSNTE